METKKDLIEKAKVLGVVGYSRMKRSVLAAKIAEAEIGVDKGIETVRKIVAETVRDEFPDGTVIRWQASGRYTYAAVKAGNGSWYTTAASFNSYVNQILDFEGLMDVITRSEVTEVAVATEWETLD